MLVKGKSGQTNWEGIAKKPGEVAPKPEKKKAPEGAPGKGLPIKGLAVGEFAVTNGTLLWIDHKKGERKEITDLNVRLQDVSLDRPIRLVLTAMLDGRPIELKAKVGPVGKEPGKGTLPLDITLKALKELQMALKGKLVDPATNKQFDLAVQISPFSPRSRMAFSPFGNIPTSIPFGWLRALTGALANRIWGATIFLNVCPGVMISRGMLLFLMFSGFTPSKTKMPLSRPL
ncbi:MAG: hypothetical protein JRJ03_15515 [Deltaproteobacteria bacterium]|nr:hypothetical protein [Deltaproteobacteria bacterium]